MAKRNQKHQYAYGTKITVPLQKFYAKGKFKEGKKIRQLSKEMNEIRNIVGSIAVDRLTDKGFIKFYNNDSVSEFLTAHLTPLHDTNDKGTTILGKDKKPLIVGFLFSSFFEGKEETGDKVLIGKAFPGIRVENRLNKNGTPKTWDRNKLYEDFLQFYYDAVFEILQKTNSSLVRYKLDTLDKTQIVDIIRSLKNNAGSFPKMRLEVYIENPLTYRDLCNYDFKYNLEKATEEFKMASALWDTGELLKQSYLKSNEKNHDALEPDVDFSVNLTPEEWRRYFKMGTKDVNIRYYLWLNYHFPNNAFKAVIPLDAHNVWKVIKASQGFKAKPSQEKKDIEKEVETIL